MYLIFYIRNYKEYLIFNQLINEFTNLLTPCPPMHEFPLFILDDLRTLT